MSATLHDRLRQTHRRLKRLLFLHGLFAIALAALVIVVLAAVTDYFFHASPGLRILFLSALAGVCGWLAIEHLFRPLLVPIRDLDLALRLERLNPFLGEQLSTTIDFLGRGGEEALAGSNRLRQAVIDDTLAASERIEFDSVVNPEPTRALGIWTACALVVAVSLAMASPSAASLALRRLANPFGGPDWPKRSRLEFVSAPNRIAIGDPFHAEVRVLGEVPEQLFLLHRRRESDHPERVALRPSKDGLFRGTLEGATNSFAFSVIGGDDQLPWREVDVVPPPEPTQLNLVLTFPKYTKLEPEHAPEGKGQVKAVIGTTVALTGESNKPLARAELRWGKAGSSPAQLLQNGVGFRAEFRVEQDDEYQIVLTDTDGLSNANRSPKRYRVQADRDAVPEIAFEKPASDIDVTPEAVVPLRLLAKDDFGIGAIELRYLAAANGAMTDTKESSLPLWKSADGSRRQVAEQRWELASLGLKAGNVVRIHAVAADLCDNPAPNLGKSREIQLRVVSKQDLARQLENQQQLLHEDLARVLKLQQAAHGQVDDLQKQAEIVGKLNREQVEHLESAELLQRRVREKLIDSGDSVMQQATRLLEQLRDNEIEEVESNQRLAMIRSELARLSEQHLPVINQSLTQARKSAKTPSADSKSSGQDQPAAVPDRPNQSSEGKPADSESAVPRPGQAKGADSKEQTPAGKSASQADSKTVATKSSSAVAGTQPDAKTDPKAGAQNHELPQSLAKASEHQGQVEDSLSELLGQLEKWETVPQLVNEARDLQRRQAETSHQVDELAKATLGKETDKLQPEEKAELARAGGRQETNRQQMDQIQQKMVRLGERLAQDDPLTADLLKEAAEQSQQQNITGKMADAARAIQENKLSDAKSRQQEVDRALADLVQSLEDRREQELARLVKQLQQAEKDLEQVREEQRRLLKKTQEAQKIEDPAKREDELKRLRKQQQELQQKVEEFARRLSRMRADQASARSGRAASRMNQAGQRLERGQGQDAEDQQQQAEEELEQAQQELAEARQQAEEELAREQLAKVADSIRQVHQREAALKDDVVRLDAERQKAGRLTRGQMQTLQSLGRAQDGLAKEAKHLTEKLSAAKVFVMVIDEAVEQMNQAAAKLGERESGEPAQQPMDESLRKFAALLESLKADPNQGGGNANQGGEGGGQGGGGAAGIPDIAQVKLLKNMQVEINQETLQLAQKLGNDALPEPEKSAVEDRFQKLSERQGKLADLVRDMTEPAAEPPLQPQEEEPKP